MADRKPLVIGSEFYPSELETADRLEISGFITTADVDMGGFNISNMADASAATDAVTLQQLQAALAGRDAKDNVIVVSVADETLSGLPTIDGETLTDGQRVLLTGQSTGSENGIWEVHAGAWTRPSDFDTGSSAEGAFVVASAGTVYEGTMWVAVADSPNDVVDTDDPSFIQLPSSLVAGDGIDITGSVISVSLATDSGLEFTTGDLQLDLADATLAKDATGVYVVGLPLNFEVNGVATGNDVTAANLDTLTDGSNADALHTHAGVGAVVIEESLTVEENITAGDPVEWGTTNDQVRQCRAEIDARVDCFGVAETTATTGNPATIVRRGVATGVLTGATVGTRYYCAVGGGLTTTAPTGSGNNIILIGTAKNATDLEVHPQYLGKKAV